MVTESVPTEEAVPPVEELEPEAVQEEPEVQPDEAPESGTPEGADEAPPDPEELLLGLIDEMSESNPDLAKKMREKAGIPEPTEDVEEQRTKWELEQAQGELQSGWGNALQDAKPFAPQSVQGALEGFFEEANGNLSEAAKAFERGTDGVTADSIKLDSRTSAQQLAQWVNQAQQAAAQVESQRHRFLAFNAMQQDPTYARMTAEERQQFRQFRAQNNIAEALKMQLRAADRANPESAAKAEAAKASKSAELMEKAAPLLAAMRKGTKGADGPAPSQEKSDTEMLLDPNTPPEKLMEIRARQRAKE